MKTQIRHNLLKKRDILSQKEVSEAGIAVSAFFLNSEYVKVPTEKGIMLYASFKNELYTWSIIDALFSKGIKVILPKTQGNDIIPYEYGGPEAMVKDKFGILNPDPSICKRASLSDIHLVIVPGVGFDRSGNRMGFGRGYYDRFLSQLPHTVKIGLCYEFQIISSVPVCETDIPMDMLLTEKGFISCKK